MCYVFFFFSKTGHYSQKVPSLESQTSIVCNIIQFLYTVAQLNVHLGQIKVKSLLTFLKKTIKGFQLSSNHFHPPPPGCCCYLLWITTEIYSHGHFALTCRCTIYMYKYVQFAFLWAKRTRSSRWWPLSMIIWLHVTSLIYKAAYEFVKTSLYFIYLVIKIVNGLCGG